MVMQTEESVRNVCVIGAGTMGAAIAAHLANLGYQVALVDVTEEAAIAGFDRMRSAKPPHFYVPDRANDVKFGSIVGNPDWVSEADWVCEAIVERLDAKRSLYEHIEALLRPDAMISTNTSGLEIALLAEGRSQSFRSRFLGTHFFNPPRYLKLLELIPTPETDPAVVEWMTHFLEERIARRVILAKDTPGFIANRYGMSCMFAAVHTAERLHLSVEQVDAITGPFLGRPKSASFRLNDIVGLDVMRDIAMNLLERCSDDTCRDRLATPSSMLTLLARGWIGDKVGQGYYRREGRELLAIDLQTFAYRQKNEVNFPSIEGLKGLPLGPRIRQGLDLRDEVGEFLREYLVPTLRYANTLKEEISHSVLDFDRVMEWGFGWEAGPFSMMDQIGHERLGVSAKPFFMPGKIQTFSGPYVNIVVRPEYQELKDFPVIGGGETYVLRDLGDGVTSVGLSSKMGIVSPMLVGELTALLSNKALDQIVLTGETRAFSAGFDLNFFAEAIEREVWDEIEAALIGLQSLGELLEEKRAVAAVSGYCLGAGFELALSCAHIVAGVEAQIGLPEARVGLIPGGRGTVLARLNNQYTPKRLAEVTMTLVKGTIAGNADEARTLGLLRPTDVTVYHPDKVLSQAKELAVKSFSTVRPEWKLEPMPLIGMIDRDLALAQTAGDLSPYDVTIGNKLKQILSKSESYEQAVERERHEFVDLCSRTMTQARIRHMLETGKPLRN